MTEWIAPESGGNFPIDLRQLVNLWAWRDASFKSRLLSDPAAAIGDLAEQLGLDLPRNVEYRVVEDPRDVFTIPVADNPVGAPPAEIVRLLQQKSEQFMDLSGGAVCTLTAECLCGSTHTGGCPCLTIWGTPCISCGGPFVAETLKLELGEPTS